MANVNFQSTSLLETWFPTTRPEMADSVALKNAFVRFQISIRYVTLAELSIIDTKTGTEQILPVDAVLVSIGFESALGPLKKWSLDLIGGQIKVDSMMRTTRPGVFAAGDVATYPGKLKLIATGFAEAATAVNYSKNYLDPTAKVFPGHSTNLNLSKR